jgi:hypothetical protein
MTAGIRWVQEHGVEPDVMVTLTDGITDFGDTPPFPHIWCISTDQVAPEAAGITVHFEME